MVRSPDNFTSKTCTHSPSLPLLSVTPFMPVSDFICEYCSQVIIREETALATREAAEARIEEHDKQLKREEQRKLQAATILQLCQTSALPSL